MPFLIITTRPDDDLRAEVKRHAKDTRQEERAPAIRGDQRMAYLMREHLRRLREQLEAAEHVSRRAVAALEEARKACLDIVRPLAREALKRPAGDPIADVCLNLMRTDWAPEVVSLPDGTTIEVVPVTEDQLRAAVAGYLDGAYTRPFDEIIEAYNQMQEAS